GQTRLVGRVGLAVTRELRHRLYARLMRAGLAFYDQTPAGAIISRLTDDVAAVQSLITGQTVTVLAHLGTAHVVTALLLCRSPLLGAVVIALLPLYAWTVRSFGRRMRVDAAAVRVQLDAVFSHLKAKVDGVLVVKACAREQAEMDDFAARIDAAHKP